MHCTTRANIRTKETSQSCCHHPPTSNQSSSGNRLSPLSDPTARTYSPVANCPAQKCRFHHPDRSHLGKFTTRERFLLYDPKVQLKTCLALPVKEQRLLSSAPATSSLPRQEEKS